MKKSYLQNKFNLQQIIYNFFFFSLFISTKENLTIDYIFIDII